MPLRIVNLSNEQAHFVDANVGRHNFANASAVIRAGLRLLERRGPEAAVEPCAKMFTAEEARQYVDELPLRIERRIALEERMTVLVASCLQSGDYRYVADVLADMAEYVDMRVDHERPAPDARHLRIVTPASNDA